MSLQVQLDRFNHLRNHIKIAKNLNQQKRYIITGVKTKISIVKTYQQKRNSRISRENLIKNDLEIIAFFDWIFDIQTKLKLTTKQFIAKINKLGGKVSIQTLSLWRRRRGHFPCDRNYRALLILDKQANLVNIEIKDLVKETTTELLLK